MTLEQAFYKAKAQKVEKGKQNATIDEYDKAFHQFLEPYKKIKIQKLHKRILKRWFDHYKDTYGKISRSKFNKFRDVISCIFTYLEVEGLIDFSYTEAIRLVNLNRELYTTPVESKSEEELWFNEEEQALLITYFREHPDLRNMALQLLLDTGMRPGEICALNTDCIDLRGYITVRRRLSRYMDNGHVSYMIVEKAKTAKGNRVVVVSDACVDILHMLFDEADDDGYVMHNITVKNLTDRLSTICKKLGIRHRSADKLRKTASTNMRISGMSDHDIIEQNGHTSISMTEKCYIQRAVEAPLRRQRFMSNQSNQ